MTDPLELLWPLMDSPSTMIAADLVAFWPPGLHQRLLELGVLRQAGNAERILCPECRNHVEEVVALPGAGGLTRYAIACPEAMRVIVPPAVLQQWIADAGQLAIALVTTLRLTGQPKELSPDRLWRLGRWRYQGATRDMLLARGFDLPDALEFRREITAAKRPIIFVVSSVPATEYWIGGIPPLIRLPDVATLVDGKIELDTPQIVGLVHDADAEMTDSDESLSGQMLSLVLDQKVRSAVAAQLNDEQILQAYVANDSSARRAAKDLTDRGFPIHHATVSRTVKKYEEVLRTASSESVVRTRSSQRRDTPIEKKDSGK